MAHVLRDRELAGPQTAIRARGGDSSDGGTCPDDGELLGELNWVLAQLGTGNAAGGDSTIALGPSLVGEETGEAGFDGLLGEPEDDGVANRLGTYLIVKPIGGGGMGVVFEAIDEQLGRAVALKVLRLHLRRSATARQRFLREARAAASLEHDHVAAIYQVGEDRSIPFLVMPLLQGESLEQRLRRVGRLPELEVLRIGRELSEGLAAAHTRGLIHRDIKPANIWLEGELGRVKLLDFGLARPKDGPQDELTGVGEVVGTLSYMAPEQFRGGSADERSDVFSLGSVMHRMSTGRLPFQSPVEASPADPSRQGPEAAREGIQETATGLSDLIARMISEDPASRPGTASGVAADLEALEVSGELALRSGSVPFVPSRRPSTPRLETDSAGCGGSVGLWPSAWPSCSQRSTGGTPRRSSASRPIRERSSSRPTAQTSK